MLKNNRVLLVIRRWLKSPSVQFAFFTAMLMYVSYSLLHQAWKNQTLIALSVFIAFFLPWYARFSNYIEQQARQLSLSLFCGRLARFIAQYIFNIIVFLLLARSNAPSARSFILPGGAAGIALLTTMASLGAQEIALRLAQAGKGDTVRNVQIGLSINIIATALATLGFATFVKIYTLLAALLGVMGLGLALYSDLLALFPPRGGVACLFGTFNPIHREHIALALRAIEKRGVEKVYLHPTGVPRGHQDALDRGEIKIACIDKGFIVYERTEKADSAVDYFPTGNRFLQPETRIELIRLAIRESGLEGRIEPLWLPDIYQKKGFPGILSEIAHRHPAMNIHVLHGNDTGGFLVRTIADAWGWWPRISPMAVRRTPGVSATAIRAGITGLTTPAVEQTLTLLGSNKQRIVILEKEFYIDDEYRLHAVNSGNAHT